MKKLGVIGLIVLIMSIGSPLLYSYTWIRWGLLIVILAVIWMKRDLLIGGLFGEKKKLVEK